MAYKTPVEIAAAVAAVNDTAVRRSITKEYMATLLQDMQDSAVSVVATVAEVRDWTGVLPKSIHVTGRGTYVWDVGSSLADDTTEATPAIAVRAQQFGRYLPSGVGSITAHLPNGTTQAVTGVAGITSVTGGVANALPQYCYGRDAASLLAELKSDAGASMFFVGDSQTVYASLMAAGNWPHIPIGGLQATMSSALMAPTYAGTVANWGHGVPLNSTNGLLYTTQFAVIATTTVSQVNWLVNRISGASVQHGASSVTCPDGNNMVPIWQGKELKAYQVYRSTPDGINTDKLALQVWTSGQYGTAASRGRSAGFRSRSTAAAGHFRKEASLPATATWTLPMQVSIETVDIGPAATIIGETLHVIDGPWIELADGTGKTLFNFASGGSTVGTFLDDAQVVRDTLYSSMRLMMTKDPWFLIDIGTNGITGETDKQHHARNLMFLIGKLRYGIGVPDAKIVLRSSYPRAAALTPADYYAIEAMKYVAEHTPNVVFVDTFSASYAGHTYAQAVALGWFGGSSDGVHRDTPGKTARERLFDAIVQGGAIPYSDTLG